MDYKCKTVDIINVNRGILLALVAHTIKDYHNLIDKDIIVENKKYRKEISDLFPDLHFTGIDSTSNNKYYYNIRKIIKKQDLIIDYINNYEGCVNAEKKISVVPWYDGNDALIMYKYDNENKVGIDKYKNFITNFSGCKRGNYDGNNVAWDKVMEDKILNRYSRFMGTTKHLSDLFEPQVNKIATTPAVFNYDVTLRPSQIIQKCTPQVITNTITVENESKLNDFIKIMNDKINALNNIN